MQLLRLGLCLLLLAGSSLALRGDKKASGDKANCAPCLKMANSLLGSSCSDPSCAVRAFASQQEKVMAEKDGPQKLMDVYACAMAQKCDLTGAQETAKELNLAVPDSLPSGAVSFVQMGMTSGGCPLCEAFDKCLHACARFRHEDEPSWTNPASANWTPFCIQRCGKAEPGNEMPEQGFKGTYVDPATQSHNFVAKWSKLLGFS